MERKSESPAPNPFQVWRAALLESRGLQRPDGRALFEYRVTAEEFAALETLLRGRLQRYQTYIPLATVARGIPGFPELLVLYASEWWRRRFDGAHWAWEPILSALEARTDTWTPVDRAECITRGLRAWGLALQRTSGLRYLGSIAIQGGLPMRLLAEAHGNLGRLLRTVLGEAKRARVTEEQILRWVRSQDHLLPRTYRRDEIHRLLAGVVHTVLQLVAEAGLTTPTDALPRLQAAVPNWRDRFPLPVEDEHAQGIIDALIREASHRPPETRIVLSIERSLQRDPSGQLRLQSGLELPDRLAPADLALVFGIPAGDLPIRFTLRLVAGDGSASVGVRRLAGRDVYHVQAHPIRFLDQSAVSEHVLQLLAPDGRCWQSVPVGGEALEDDLPWLFAAQEGDAGFLRQGGGRVAPASVLALVPPGTRWTEPPAGAVAVAGVDRDAWLLEADARCTLPSGEGFRCRPGNAQALRQSLQWQGDRVWQGFGQGWLAFRGQPVLYARQQAEPPARVRGTVCWRIPGVQARPVDAPLGPVIAWVEREGEQHGRQRMVILPPQARLRLESTGSDGGVIHFDDWGLVSASAADEALAVTTRVLQTDGQQLSLAVTLPSATSERPPEHIDLRLYWPQSPTPVPVRLPFPAIGVRCFDAGGRELPPETLLSARKLVGSRLLVMAGDPEQRLKASLSLQAGQGQRVIQRSIRFNGDAVQAEVRLLDYRTEVEELLSADDHADAQVRLSVRLGAVNRELLRIARYDARLQRVGDDILLDGVAAAGSDSDTLAGAEALALKLEEPADEPIRLLPMASEGVALGRWRFPPAEHGDPGAWLIHPPADGTVAFRPTLWPVPGAYPEGDVYVEAIRIPDTVEREAALIAMIEAMALDYAHPAWPRIGQLASHLQHLPLTTLDIWRCFARSPAGMAALVIGRSQLPSGFVERFPVELPVALEAIPHAAWRSAIRCLITARRAAHPPEVADVLLDWELGDQLDALIARYPNISWSVNLARLLVRGEDLPEMRVLLQVGPAFIEQRLYGGADSPVQQLLRRQHGDAGFEPVWPTDLTAWIEPCKSGHRPFFNPVSMGYRDSVIDFPVALAIQAATAGTDDWFGNPQAVERLRSYVEFDPEWFEETYNWTIARCFQSGWLSDPQQ